MYRGLSLTLGAGDLAHGLIGAGGRDMAVMVGLWDVSSSQTDTDTAVSMGSGGKRIAGYEFDGRVWLR